MEKPRQKLTCRYPLYLDIIVTVSPSTACVYESRSKKKLARVNATVAFSLPWNSERKTKQIILNRIILSHLKSVQLNCLIIQKLENHMPLLVETLNSFPCQILVLYDFPALALHAIQLLFLQLALAWPAYYYLIQAKWFHYSFPTAVQHYSEHPLCLLSHLMRSPAVFLYLEHSKLISMNKIWPEKSIYSMKIYCELPDSVDDIVVECQMPFAPIANAAPLKCNIAHKTGHSFRDECHSWLEKNKEQHMRNWTADKYSR